ncbi:MAG TPA: hypothetical protein EYN91_17200 [Candidatus Melainabacteria bacterium]|nr:hypothetical protein [Candidatus Melainabacteria bacterium]HIN64003.1 hypothetical protein [Candidatus Obscuribacterales bacterium]
MAVEEKVSKAKSKLSSFDLVFLASTLILSALFLSNTIAILQAAAKLNEIGAQCAYAAAHERSETSAQAAVQKVIERHKPDGFFVREPLTCSVIVFRNSRDLGREANKDIVHVPIPYATVKTSFAAWVPASFLFTGTLDKHIEEATGDHSVVRFSALHTSPYLTLYDETQKSGRTSI